MMYLIFNETDSVAPAFATVAHAEKWLDSFSLAVGHLARRGHLAPKPGVPGCGGGYADCHRHRLRGGAFFFDHPVVSRPRFSGDYGVSRDHGRFSAPPSTPLSG